MKIKELSLSERPRERLLSYGPAAVSNGELLSILLRSGTKQLNVLEVAQTLLRECEGSLVKISQLSIEHLCHFPGIKADKAATLVAAFELGRRFISETSCVKEKAITCCKDAYRALIPMFKGLEHEEAWVIFLDKGHRIIDIQSLGIGSDDRVVIAPRQIVRRAIELSAISLIIAHNHPSGNPEPSEADINMTLSIHNTCKTCDTNFLDHIVVTDHNFYGFAEEKIVSPEDL